MSTWGCLRMTNSMAKASSNLKKRNIQQQMLRNKLNQLFVVLSLKRKRYKHLCFTACVNLVIDSLSQSSSIASVFFRSSINSEGLSVGFLRILLNCTHNLVALLRNLLYIIIRCKSRRISSSSILQMVLDMFLFF